MPDPWHQVVDAAIGTHKASDLFRRAHKDSDDNRGGKYKPPKATALPQDPRPTPNNHMSFSTTGFNGRASDAHFPQYDQSATASQHQGHQHHQGQIQHGQSSPTYQHEFNVSSSQSQLGYQNYHQPGTFPADQRTYGEPSPHTAYGQSSQYVTERSN